MSGKVAGKIAVVTGANSGIGYQTVKELNLQGATVHMLCRSEERAREAISRLVKEGCAAGRLRFFPCDLSSFQSVRQCAGAILEEVDHIDILMNNAGIMIYPRYELTVDGHEMTWHSNHLGPFLLTQLLLPLVERAPSGRIVFLSSALHTHQSHPLDFSVIDKEEAWGRFAPYNRSKLANVMTARELSKRLSQRSGNKITVNSLHPGVVATDLTRHIPLIGNTPLRKPFMIFLKTEKQGAATSLHLAMSPKVEGETGGYYSDSKKAKENKLALDEAACAALYDYSMRTCGLSLSEPNVLRL